MKSLITLAIKTIQLVRKDKEERSKGMKLSTFCIRIGDGNYQQYKDGQLYGTD